MDDGHRDGRRFMVGFGRFPEVSQRAVAEAEANEGRAKRPY